MRSLEVVVRDLYADCTWFARNKSLRLLAISTGGSGRSAALQVVRGVEFHGDNRAVWMVLESPYATDSDGWWARAMELRENLEARREGFQKEGRSLGELPPPPPSQAKGLGAFGATLKSVLCTLPASLEGAVVVIAPTIVSTPGLLPDLEALLSSAEFSAVRWIVVVDETAPLSGLLSRLGAAALASDGRCPDEGTAAAIGEMLAAGVSSGGKNFGVARPDVTPPRRKNDPPELSAEARDALFCEAGLSPEYLEKAPALRQLLLGAAVALHDKCGADALRMQREARDVMLKLGLVREGLTAHLMLAGYTHALGDEKAASAEYETVRKAAATSELWALVSQAHLGMSGICMRQKDWNAAATHYTSAGHAAERGAAAGLAIEAWRLAGQLGLQVGAESQAAQCFQNALRVAEGTTASLQKVSSAPDAARTLAALCERRGLVAQARSLYEQADRYEHPFVQDAPMQDASVQRASVQDASDGRSA